MKSLLLSFVPALITGGPLFIAFSAGRISASSLDGPLLTYAGYAGALALAIGLVIMFRELLRQKQEIRDLCHLLKDEAT